MFVTRRPDGHDKNNPTDWYGQGITTFSQEEYVLNGKDYYGLPEWEHPSGWAGIKVPVVTALSILADYEFIDLIDMDIQGEEADCVDECIDLLDQKVRRLHIGTHGRDIEARLARTLTAHDWILLRELNCFGETPTAFGMIHCSDGIQSWFNPRLPPNNWQAI